MHSLILKVATRLLVGLILVFAIYLLFRGHNAPGGGFVAALVAGSAAAIPFLRKPWVLADLFTVIRTTLDSELQLMENIHVKHPHH